MPKVKTLHFHSKGVNLDYEIHVNSSGSFYVSEKGLPSELIEYIKAGKSNDFDKFSTLEKTYDWFTHSCIDYVKNGIKATYFIAARVEASHQAVALSRTDETLAEIPSLNAPPFSSDNPVMGFEIMWRVVEERAYGDEKVYRELKVGHRDTPFDKIILEDIVFIYNGSIRIREDKMTLIPFTREAYEFFKNMDYSIVKMINKVIDFIHCEPELLIEKIAATPKLIG